jgi:hypothetical protein
MSDFPETHRDLLETQVATLATVEPDGQPQLTRSGSSTTTARCACR